MFIGLLLTNEGERMNIFWIRLVVNFRKPMPFLDDDSNESGKDADGFLQEIGCTADNEEEAKRIVMDYLGGISWLDLSLSSITFDRIGVIPRDQLASEIYGDPDVKDSLISDPLVKGIWYLSGKAFSCESVDDDEFYQVKVTKKGEELD